MGILSQVKTQIKTRYPSQHRQLQVARWRLQGWHRTLPHRLDPRPNAQLREALQVLQRDGIVVRDSAEFFGHDPRLYADAYAWAHQAWEAARSTVAREGEQALTRYFFKQDKEYKIHLLPREVPADHPFMRIALDPTLLALVNQYMGMRTYLRAIHLWWDRPMAALPKGSQLWHRDLDDLMNVKVFIYFNDVGLGNGPFCFIPGTHPLGPRRLLRPEHDASWRSTDEQMAQPVPASDWKICTAPAGTVILCDTCGLHKGLKPKRSDRLMLTIQYTSGVVPAKFMRTFEVIGEPEHGRGNAVQEWALSLNPLGLPAWLGGRATAHNGSASPGSSAGPGEHGMI